MKNGTKKTTPNPFAAVAGYLRSEALVINYMLDTIGDGAFHVAVQTELIRRKLLRAEGETFVWNDAELDREQCDEEGNTLSSVRESLSDDLVLWDFDNLVNFHRNFLGLSAKSAALLAVRAA